MQDKPAASVMDRYNDTPVWYEGENKINEAAFCEEFLLDHPMATENGIFFTEDGRIQDEKDVERMILLDLQGVLKKNVARRVKDLLALLRLTAAKASVPIQTDRIHVANGTFFLDGCFLPYKEDIVRNRLPVVYDPDAPKPERWLRFLDQLLYPEDVPTLQEFIGYCLIPTNKGQRMLILKGAGGEGKSQIGAVLSAMFGSSMKDGSIGKISENRFARADLEHILLLVDDDMRMDALKQTNYVKSIVTAQGKMDLERKCQQSYQGWMFARLMGFSNGDLQSLYDRSDGFYRRQLLIAIRPKPKDRVDDPGIADKLKQELPGIFLWALEGLKRLIANDYHFTESDRAKEYREQMKRTQNNVLEFLDSEGYIRFRADCEVSSKQLYEVYRLWCEDNSLTPMKPRSFSDTMMEQAQRLNLEYTNNITNPDGRRVRGFLGIQALAHPKTVMDFSNSLRTYVPDDD